MENQESFEDKLKGLNDVIINQETIAESVKNGKVSAEIAHVLQEKLKLLTGEKGYITVSIPNNIDLQTVYLSTIKMVDKILTNDFKVTPAGEKRALH